MILFGPSPFLFYSYPGYSDDAGFPDRSFSKSRLACAIVREAERRNGGR
jgi:hypothetical protein